MILDNLNIHKNEAARRWLQRHPRVHFHYTPTHASWVNMVESSRRVRLGVMSARQRFSNGSPLWLWTRPPAAQLGRRAAGRFGFQSLPAASPYQVTPKDD
jgi:DDE superfamily endonuclease